MLSGFTAYAVFLLSSVTLPSLLQSNAHLLLKLYLIKKQKNGTKVGLALPSHEDQQLKEVHKAQRLEDGSTASFLKQACLECA